MSNCHPILAAADPVSSPGVIPMVILGLIMTATYVTIAFEWLHKSLAAMLGAIIAVAAGLALGLFHAAPGETAYKYVHHVIGHDLGVLGVIVGTSILVEIAGRSGLFHFIAVKIVKKTRGAPGPLFVFMCVLTVVFVTFLTIAPGTLIMVSLALVVTKALDYDPKPYLVGVAISANSGALMTFASGICTLMLGTAGKLAYMDFFRVTTPMAALSAAVGTLIVRRFYRASLVASGDPEARQRTIDAFDEWALVKDRRLFYRAAGILAATIIGFALAQTIGVGLDYVALAGGTAALLLSGVHPEEAIKKINWSVIMFFVGLFVIIGAVQASGLLAVVSASMLGLSSGDHTATMLILAGFVLVFGGVVDNIPLAATMIPIVRGMADQGIPVEPIWWALIIAANLSGNPTPVGSISNVIALSALEKERGIRVGWGEFLKVGGSVLAAQGVLMLVYLYGFAKFGLFPGGR